MDIMVIICISRKNKRQVLQVNYELASQQKFTTHRGRIKHSIYIGRKKISFYNGRSLIALIYIYHKNSVPNIEAPLS